MQSSCHARRTRARLRQRDLCGASIACESVHAFERQRDAVRFSTIVDRASTASTAWYSEAWFREVGTRRYSIWWSTGTRVRYSLSEYRAHRAILRAFRLAAEYVEVCCILRLELTRREIAQKRGLWSTERKACSTASTRFDGEYDRVERSIFGTQSGSVLARSMALLETAAAMHPKKRCVPSRFPPSL